MFHDGSLTLTLRTSARKTAFALAGVLILIFAALAAGHAQPAPATSGDARSFFESVTGDWIGTCVQSTNGEQAENKYFRATVKKVDDSTFEGRFEYYRPDGPTGSLVNIGETTVSITVGPDGTTASRINGRGTMLVENKPKDQKHELSEVLTYADDGTLQGHGSGKIEVSGMSFGVGKNGRISSSHSIWSLRDGVLTVSQAVRADFRVLFFSKGFDVTADMTASRGNDVASLLPGKVEVGSVQAGDKTPGS